MGTLIADAGTTGTAVLDFAMRAKLAMRPLPAEGVASVRVADGMLVDAVGIVALPIMVQLMLQVDGGQCALGSAITLRNVVRLPLGSSSPRDVDVVPAAGQRQTRRRAASRSRWLCMVRWW